MTTARSCASGSGTSELCSTTSRPRCNDGGETMTTRREPSRFELDMLARMSADLRCASCGAEHGKPHPDPPSTHVFLHVVAGDVSRQVIPRNNRYVTPHL